MRELLTNRLRISFDAPNARLETQVQKACAGDRRALEAMGSKLGTWAGLGDRRQVETSVDAKIARYLAHAVLEGQKYGRFVGFAVGIIVFFLTAIVGVLMNL